MTIEVSRLAICSVVTVGVIDHTSYLRQTRRTINSWVTRPWAHMEETCSIRTAVTCSLTSVHCNAVTHRSFVTALEGPEAWQEDGVCFLPAARIIISPRRSTDRLQGPQSLLHKGTGYTFTAGKAVRRWICPQYLFLFVVYLTTFSVSQST
jgi:hypothetical protein